MKRFYFRTMEGIKVVVKAKTYLLAIKAIRKAGIDSPLELI